MNGLYVLDERSAKFLAEQEQYKLSAPTIELTNDGTYLAKNLPDEVVDGFGESHGELIYKVGKWHISEMDDQCLFELEGIAVFPLMMANDRPALLLSIGPKDNDGLAFIKKVQ